MLRWLSQLDGDKQNYGILWGEPIQLGPDKWHVYGAHRGRWIPLNVEFLPDKIVLVYPQGVRKRKYNSANVRRQVSLAGRMGGSQKLGVKALGMLCCQHPLCLNAKSRNPPLERPNGQRLAERPCSASFCSIHVPIRLPSENRRGFLDLLSPEFFISRAITAKMLKNKPRKNHSHALRLLF
ncbi:MAG: hypothetical protein M0Q93_12990 [Terrimicrobiaceae bacterium]|nr:hypothetical protein [Terrimicrobiaceae bacterium]